jgi:hypothetical protein
LDQPIYYTLRIIIREVVQTKEDIIINHKVEIMDHKEITDIMLQQPKIMMKNIQKKSKLIDILIKQFLRVAPPGKK